MMLVLMLLTQFRFKKQMNICLSSFYTTHNIFLKMEEYLQFLTDYHIILIWLVLLFIWILILDTLLNMKIKLDLSKTL